jgi:hypothetical protein
MTTMEEQIIPTIGSFWNEFGFGRLYDTGWADVIRSSNALAPLPTREELLISCAFLNGAAQVVVTTQPYMSRSWQIAHQIAVFAQYSVLCLQERLDGTIADLEGLKKMAANVKNALLKILDTEIDSTIA